jgi:hypothetical protein
MQEEVTKHTKKIYDTAKSAKYTFGEKVKEIIIEILIIVFAVTISIWFHNWSDHRHEQTEVKEFLKGLSDNLTDDVHQLTTNKNVIAHLQSNYKKILLPGKAHVSDIDSLVAHFEVDLRVTRPNIGRYEGFKSSGKIGNIKNDSLRENILVFYEQTIPGLVYGENFVNNLQVNIQNLSFEKGDKVSPREFPAIPKINSLLWLEAHNFEVNMRGYDKAADDARKIIEQIKNEVKE